MSEAVDQQDVTRRITESIREAPSWSPGSVYVTENEGLQKSQCLTNPETVRNPPAPRGGTRAPSAWNKKWFRYTEMPKPFSTRVKAGKNGWTQLDGSYWSSLGRYFGWNVKPVNDADYLAPGPFDRFTADNIARTKLLKKASQVKWDLSVTAVEVRETAQLLGSLATDVVRTYQKYATEKGLRNVKQNLCRALDAIRSSGPPGSAAQKHYQKEQAKLLNADSNALERFRDRWMEYQFGIRPTVADLQDAAKYVSSLNEGAPPQLLAKGGHSVPYKRVIHTGPTSGIDVAHRITGEVQVHLAVVYGLPSAGISPITQLGLDRPLVTLWEKTRLSWMVDYFVDFGSWFESMGTANHLKFISGTKSTLWKASLEPLQAVVTDPNLEWDKKIDPRYFCEGGEFQRELLSSSPLPSLIPQVKTTLGLTQLANTLSAMSNVFGGKPRGY